MSENTTEEIEPHLEAKWKVIFSLNSWWRTADKRTIVICQRWYDKDHNIHHLGLLEEGLEQYKIVSYKDWYTWYHAGKLTRTSSPGDPDVPVTPRSPSPNLYIERSF